MGDELLFKKVVSPISTSELERRWHATRGIMKEKKVDFLLIQNRDDYLGGYVKWFTDLSAYHSYPLSVIFPRSGQMTTIRHGPADPKKSGPPEWLVRGVKKRITAPIMLSLNYTTSYDAEKVVEELKGYKNICIGFVNEGSMTTAFTSYVRKHLINAKFVDFTNEVDQLKAIKSQEEIERIKVSAIIHDEAWKACLDAIKPGVTEYEVAAIARSKCRMLGSEQQFVLIGSAPAGKSFPYNPIHAMNRKLENGDQIGVLIEANDSAGYYTHLHRIACIGSISGALQEQFEIAKLAQQQMLGLIKPDISPLEVLEANNEYLTKLGYSAESRISAHGQGYDLVERPSFQPGETMILKKGMNIGVHPVVASKHATALLTDNYIITDSGVSECLHETAKEIFLI